MITCFLILKVSINQVSPSCFLKYSYGSFVFSRGPLSGTQCSDYSQIFAVLSAFLRIKVKKNPTFVCLRESWVSTQSFTQLTLCFEKEKKKIAVDSDM